MQSQGIWSTLWRKYADYKYNKFERFAVWEMIEPYRRPKTFTALITIYVAAFYTGVIGAAVTEQLYKVSFASVIDSREKFWEEHPGKTVPLMKPLYYRGPWRVYRGEAIASDASSSQ
ncbi:hypothetical protein HID58_000731 [Brassica napus]|uniref:Uncharacterized protein n=1 Tax=Brassica napus TaxID=3708 RepID=A0ABQ8EHK1_BRANA|nr:hypothetical protein HID58_000731 [Brassica napus]